MHEGLGLGCAGVEHSACIEEGVEDVGVLSRLAVMPTYGTGVAGQVSEVDVFFDGDG